MSPLGASTTIGLLFHRRMMDDKVCAAVGVMTVREVNLSTRSARSKAAYLPLCQPEISHDLSQARILALRGGKPATNRLRYNTAFRTILNLIVNINECSDSINGGYR
jgi:hypothetical protein